MINIVCYIIFGFLIILGIVDIIEFVVLKLFKYEKCDYFLINEDNIEYFLRTIKIQCSWKNKPYPKNELNNFLENDKNICKIYKLLHKDFF